MDVKLRHICRISSNLDSHFLKQTLTPTEWNPERPPNVAQMYHHWLKLISKYESLSSEKIASSIKIALALQNVRGPLKNALSVSINEKSTWSETHHLLSNYFNNNIPSTQRRSISSTCQGSSFKEDSVNQVGKRGKGKSKKSKGQSKGKGSSQSQGSQKGKGRSKSSKWKTKSNRKGHWTTWSGPSPSWSCNQGQGGKGKRTSSMFSLWSYKSLSGSTLVGSQIRLSRIKFRSSEARVQ